MCFGCLSSGPAASKFSQSQGLPPPSDLIDVRHLATSVLLLLLLLLLSNHQPFLLLFICAPELCSSTNVTPIQSWPRRHLKWPSAAARPSWSASHGSQAGAGQRVSCVQPNALSLEAPGGPRESASQPGAPASSAVPHLTLATQAPPLPPVSTRGPQRPLCYDLWTPPGAPGPSQGGQW